MTQWYANELSKLTQVSVRTLHHYDRIDLLKPSLRLANGYRLYSEKDLLKLQQIIALKFFGFELAQIKTLLQQDVDVMNHFSAQSQLLKEKARAFFEASQTLDAIISDCSTSKSISWETILKSIEVYRMTQELEETWAGRVLNAKELQEYAEFQHSLKERSESEKVAFEQSWAALVAEVETHLDQDPASNLGIDIGKRCMEMINAFYGKRHAALRTAIWEKGFKTGQTDGEHALSPAIVTWLDKAMDAYYRDRIYNILQKIETDSSATVLKLWQQVLEDMYGDSQEPKHALYSMAMDDPKISQAAKEWLRTVAKL